MALARFARTGLRRSGGAIGNYTNKRDIISVDKQVFLTFCHSMWQSSRLSSIKKTGHMNFWGRGIRVTPQYQFPQAQKVIVEFDSECETMKYPTLAATRLGKKPRVVVLGTGWAACRFFKGLDTKLYDVVCISPRNHMVFTPLLASTCVGTLEFWSVVRYSLH